MATLVFRFCVVAVCIFVSGCGERPVVKAYQLVRSSVEATVSSVNSGTVEAEKVADLAFGAVGRVQALHVEVGDSVKQGAILAELENSDLKSMRDTAEREAQRLEELYRSRVSATTERDRKRSDYEMALAAFEKSLIRAPFDGMIAEINLEVGQLSQITTLTTKPMIRIVDVEPRYVKANIDEVDLSLVTVGQKARVKILAARREPFEGSVRRVTPVISTVREQDRTSEIEIALSKLDTLLPVGASADVEIVVDEHRDVLTAPTRAVLGRRESRFVYRLDGSTVERVPVKVGLGNFDRTEILEGLTASDTVILPCDDCELETGSRVIPEIVPWR